MLGESKKFQEGKMMNNVILPIVERVEDYKKFILNHQDKDIKFFVGITEKLKNSLDIKAKNVEIKVFADGSNKEQIINALHSCKLKKGNILIVRRPLTDDEFLKLTNSESDISVLKPKHNKFFSMIKKWLAMLIKKIFAFNFFGDISAICFKENMFELLCVCKNLSMASRLNKFVGVSVEEIQTSQKGVKKEYNRWSAFLKFLFWCLILGLSIGAGVCICLFSKVHVLIIVLVVFLIFVAFMFWLMVGLLGLIRTIEVGDLTYGRAQQIL